MVLPRNRARTELGYLRCFITDTLADIMVVNTNAYAQSLAASPPFVTDAAEMWRFIAARIRMGIAPLPEQEMYWRAEYSDGYVTQLSLVTASYYSSATGALHLRPLTMRHTVVEKVSALYHDCQTLFRNAPHRAVS